MNSFYQIINYKNELIYSSVNTFVSLREGCEFMTQGLKP